jgi:hypothetical protein
VDAARGLSTLIGQLGAAAGLDLDTKTEEPAQVEQIWRLLNARSAPYLLILDNFPENTPLRPYLPTTGPAHTIVTTRRRDLQQAVVGLDALSPEEGVRLLNSGQRQLGKGAEELVRRLGGLPLALELAKSYLNYRRDLSIEVLLKEMTIAGEMQTLAEFASEYRDELPNLHERDIVATFQMSWNITPDAAKRVLRVIGELAPAPVPRWLVREILGLPEQLPMRDELSKSLSELARLSWVELDEAGDPLAHRLILASVRHQNVAEDASPFDPCVAMIRQQMRRAFDNPGANTIRDLESLVPHAEFLTAKNRIGREDRSDLLNSLGGHHQKMGRFTAAREVYSAALLSDEKALTSGPPSIATVQSNLALVLRDRDSWRKRAICCGRR